MISVLLLAVRTSALRAPIAIRRSRMATLGAGSVEVEEKFAVSGDRDAFAARVKAAGGSATSSVRFHDEYFDTSSLALTSQDTWLRRRDGAWELKIPHGDRVASGGEQGSKRERNSQLQRLIFGRAIISRNGIEAWMLFYETRAREHSR